MQILNLGYSTLTPFLAVPSQDPEWIIQGVEVGDIQKRRRRLDYTNMN